MLTPTSGGVGIGELGATSERRAVPPAYSGKRCYTEGPWKGGCYWYVENEVKKNAIGMEYITNVSEPRVSSFPGAHSIDQLNLGAGGPGDDHNTIEAGIDVAPEMFGGSQKPHFFIYLNNNEYASGGEDCYDCKQFVPYYETKLIPGDTLEPSGAHYRIGVEYWLKKWWFWAGTQWIGYVEPSFWKNEFKKGEAERDYGEVFDNGERPTSQMGNGQPGKSASATLMTAPVVIINENLEETTTLGTKRETRPALYSLGDLNSEKTTWHFGGNGVPDPTPAVVREEGGSNADQWVDYEGTNEALWSALWNGTKWGTGDFGEYGSGFDMARGSNPAIVREEGGSNADQWVYYRGSDGALHVAYWEGKEWKTASFAYLGAYVAEGTSPVVVREKGTGGSDKDQWVYYQGTNGAIWSAFWNGKEWGLGDFGEYGPGWYMAEGTSPSVVREEGGSKADQWVDYEGTNGALWSALWNGKEWGTGDFGVFGSGFYMAPDTNPAAVREPGGSNADQWVYYQGTNGALWSALWNGKEWGTGDFGEYGSGFYMAPDTNPAVVREEGGSNADQWVYYQGTNEALWSALWNGTKWGTGDFGEYGSGYDVMLGASPAVVREEGGSNADQWVYYQGTNGALWSALWNGAKWGTGDFGEYGSGFYMG